MRISSLALLIALGALSSSVVACSTGSEGSGSDDEAATASDINADVAALMTIDPSLPFAPKSFHPAAGPVLNAHWGAHGGPMVTAQNFSTPANPPGVTRWFFPSPGLTAPASASPVTTKLPDNLPTARSWSVAGFIDLPDLGVSLQAYAGNGDQLNGEAFLFSKNYDAVVTRANVNGFSAGVGVTDGSANRIVYGALSPFASATSTSSDSALYASDVTATSLQASTAAVKLVSWTGSPGPVVADQDGNVFAAAFISTTGAAHTDEIYAISKKQALGAEAATQATVADADTKGTASLAVASVKGSGTGWVFAKGFDGAAPAPIYARAYSVANDAVASSGDVIAAAIKGVGTNALTVFGSPDGNLWVAVKSDFGSWFVELAPKPAPAPAPPAPAP